MNGKSKLFNMINSNGKIFIRNKISSTTIWIVFYKISHLLNLILIPVTLFIQFNHLVYPPYLLLSLDILAHILDNFNLNTTCKLP